MATRYQRVVDAIEADIAAGVLRPGDHLPSITQLAIAHKVSTTTVKNALMILRERGLVVGEQGVATYVAGPG
jgi:DNA-binding GntR family transcriptional regulator